MKKILIGISQGDTNGVGYEVIIKALADNRILDFFVPVVYGSARIMGFYRRKISNIEGFNFHVINNVSEYNPKLVNLVPCVPDDMVPEPGKITADGAKAALIALQTAVKDLKDHKIQAIVTAPFNKHTVAEKGFAFPGHTEYLSNAFLCKEQLMLLCSQVLKVGVVTGHVPLANVAKVLNKESILSKLRILSRSLKNDFNIEQPKIALLGLNPHAGEAGLLGNEEQDVIVPAIDAAQQEGILAFGPYPSDSFFANYSPKKFDAVLAMYHDQGLIPFKTMAFYSGVNFTAGLPVVRTSPDHGTAYDIAGKDIANEQSMRAALYLAYDIYRTREANAELGKNPLKSYRFEGTQAG